MKAKVKKIDHPRPSRNGDVFFQRLHFTLEDGTYAMTDLVSSFRNFNRWKPVIESGIGTYVGGIFLKDNKKVNADSDVYVIQKPIISEPSPQFPVKDSVVAEIMSHSKRGIKYKIIQHSDSSYSCECVNFSMNLKILGYQCKHIKEYLNGLAEKNNLKLGI